MDGAGSRRVARFVASRWLGRKPGIPAHLTAWNSRSQIGFDLTGWAASARESGARRIVRMAHGNGLQSSGASCKLLVVEGEQVPRSLHHENGIDRTARGRYPAGEAGAVANRKGILAMMFRN